MANHVQAPRASADAWLDAERFDVYQIALEFVGLVGQLAPGRGFGELRDQLERASSSILLNAAEGLGRSSSPEKARFFIIARGSTTESAAIVDVLRVRALARSGPLRARAIAARPDRPDALEAHLPPSRLSLARR